MTPKKRSIKDISIKRRSASESRIRPSSGVRKPRVSVSKIKGPRSFRPILSIVTLLSIVVLVFVLGSAFGKAHVSITPYQIQSDFNITLTAKKSAGQGEIRFDIMGLTDSLSQTVEATGSELVEERASGTIRIFNETSSSQKLREETRFESPDGLVFKLDKGAGVTIPAGSSDSPGSVAATVYAAEPGDSYNIGLVDFVIPGWREISSPKFDTQYARSETEMTGGFVGEMFVLAEDDIDQVRSSMQDTLSERLNFEADAQNTSEFFTFEDGKQLKFTSIQKDISGSDSVEIEETGTLAAILLNKQEISDYVVEQVLDNVPAGEPVLANIEDMNIQITSTSNNDFFETETVGIRISGNGHFVWNIEESQMTSFLSRTKQKELPLLIESNDSVVDVEATVRPFWKSKFPTKENSFSIDIGADVD